MKEEVITEGDYVNVNFKIRKKVWEDFKKIVPRSQTLSDRIVIMIKNEVAAVDGFV